MSKHLDYDSKSVKDYFAHGSGSAGGVLVGKRHSEGGIKAINKSTGQPLEMEGGEVVITRKAVSDNKKREFEGEMLTNKEILSRINESGGGVKIFSQGGDIESHTCSCSGKSYKYGGRMMSDYEIMHDLSKYDEDDYYSHLSHQSYEVGGELDINGLNSTEMYVLHKLDNNIHAKCEISRKKLDEISGLEKMGIVYTTQGKTHDCYQVRLTDYGKHLLLKIDIPEGYFAKGGEMADCGCGKKYVSGGTLEQIKDSKISGITSISYSDDKKTIKYGNSNLKTTLTVNGLSKEGIQEELEMEKKFLSDRKKRIENFEQTLQQLRSSRGNQNEVEDSIKQNKSDKQQVLISENIIIPFYEYHLGIGGGVDQFPPITFDIASKEDGRKLRAEIVAKTGGNMFSIEQLGDKDKYYAKNEVVFEIIDKIWRERNGGVATNDYKYFKGIDANYKNQFEINKAIEELVENVPADKLTPEEKGFIGYFAGYGGLEKFGATGKGLLYEYFTPSVIAKKMWGLAYKYGFKGGHVLEPSCGIGEFIKYAPDQNMVTGYEINEVSAKICRILFPMANIQSKYFETLFIKNNNTIKDNLQGVKKYQLIIGNPPYGSMGGIYAGMGEKSYTKANNYIEYFISRGLDLLEKDGLLLYIIGTEVAAGGKPFLQQPITPVKKSIMEKGELIDAYRLPNGVFETTDVLTDIVVFRKK